LLAVSQEDASNHYGVFWWLKGVHDTTKGAVNMVVAQFQRVALTRDITEHHLCVGDVAYVVDLVPHPAGGESGCVLEVFNAIGESIAVVAVPVSAVEPLAADEVFAVRRLAESRE
jgi:hypothetical protein